MIRGNQTFKNIFIDTEATEAPKKKGRSSELNAKRNECLIDRYYYYGRFSKLRYDKIMEVLSEEFFLTSDITIPRIVDDNLGRLVELKKNDVSKQYFQKKWPHLKWQ